MALYCKDLDHHRTICGMQLDKQVCESEDANDYGVHVPAVNEMLVCSPLNGQVSRFVFSDKMVEFVDDFQIISSRHDLQMKGVWFPRNAI
ncbi:hypothetical protein SH449x_000594 [Pirellulaceae bacterium SH449]